MKAELDPKSNESQVTEKSNEIQLFESDILVENFEIVNETAMDSSGSEADQQN